MSGPMTVLGALGKRGDEGDPSRRPTPTRAQPRGHRKSQTWLPLPPPQYQAGFLAEERPALPAPRPQWVSARPGLEFLRWGVAGRNVVSWWKMSRGAGLGGTARMPLN